MPLVALCMDCAGESRGDDVTYLSTGGADEGAFPGVNAHVRRQLL